MDAVVPMIDDAAQRRHRRRNRTQALVLVGGMVTLMLVLAGAFAGWAGAAWASALALEITTTRA